jgi:uncharacterized protein (TIGR03437 family)
MNRLVARHFGVAVLVVAALAPRAWAQQQPEWDSTGNSLLSGTYNFREALWITDVDGNAALDEAVSQYGTITFDGRGSYTVNATEWSSTRTSVVNYTRTNTYSIAASGYGFIRRSSTDGDVVYGAVANGVFIGSNTDSGFNDLFIAARQNTSLSNASFNARYNMAYTNLATPNLGQIRDAAFQLAPNGAGGLGPINVSGYNGGGYTPVTATISNGSYTWNSNGTGVLNLGARNASALVSGSHQLFASPDGQFIFGGSTDGWDMLVGVRAPDTQPNFTGLYFQAGMDVRRAGLPTARPFLNSYAGSFNAISNVATILGHQRVQTSPDAPYEYTYADDYGISPAGVLQDALGLQHFVSANGRYRIGYGRLDYLGLNVALRGEGIQAPAGSSMFIDPTGVVNAASFSPFTTGLAPGELITLFGTGLATTSSVDASFPTTLGGVTVKINGLSAPLYVVSPTQISAVVPYATEYGIAEIRATRGNLTSNRVTAYVNTTAPGSFAVPPIGIGLAAALHPNFQLVTAANPARAGEVIAVYLTGLGETNPEVADGALGPVNPLARARNPPEVTIANRNATVAYAGLAPQLRGLYQLNVEIPAGTPGGNQYLEIVGPDTLNSQIQLPIFGARTASATPQRSRRAQSSSSSAPRTRSRFDPLASSSPSSDK